MSRKTVVLGVSGASGAILAHDIVTLLNRCGVGIDLVCSHMAERTYELELGPEALERLRGQVSACHAPENLGATIASGSCPVHGMIVAPCSMRTLAAIAHGLDDSLLTRAAGVQLKERRPLILLTREAPLTLAHLRNMVAVTEMGAIVLPPVPAFYLNPKSIEDISAQIAARAIDLLRLSPPQASAWSG
jgi:4-hydroxy-3-polyprenylbenzoate decarboxylase